MEATVRSITTREHQVKSPVADQANQRAGIDAESTHEMPDAPVEPRLE